MSFIRQEHLPKYISPVRAVDIQTHRDSKYDYRARLCVIFQDICVLAVHELVLFVHDQILVTNTFDLLQ